MKDAFQQWRVEEAGTLMDATHDADVTPNQEKAKATGEPVAFAEK